jgi:peptide/nickel transport system substrate-binding protein
MQRHSTPVLHSIDSSSAVSRRTFLGLGAVAGVSATGAVRSAFGQQSGQQTLTIGLSVDPGGAVDPRIVWNIPNISAAMGSIYEPLVSRNERMEIVPALAESWSWVNPTTMRFKLRDGVKFHNGEPFDAESAKWTIESILAPDSKSPVRSVLRKGRIDIVDRLTIHYVLEAPFRPLATVMPWVLMMPARAATQGTNFASTAIGTGPFRFVEYRPNERLVLERNPGYWGKKTILDRLTIRYIPENGTRVAALERGEVWMINNVPPDQLKRVKEHPDLRLLSSDTLRMVALAMQCDRPPFNDARVRRAVAHAIDRDALVQGILQSHGQVARAPLSPFARSYHDKLPAHPYDPARAKQLLKEAGHTGVPVKFGAPSGRYLMDKQVAEACTQFLNDVGFKVELEAVEFGVYWPKAQQATYDFYLFSRTGATTANDPVVLEDFRSTTAAINIKYKNDRLDALLKKGAESATANEAELNQIYKEAQEIIWQDVPASFLYYQAELVGVNRRLQGFSARADEMYYFSSASIM